MQSGCNGESFVSFSFAIGNDQDNEESSTRKIDARYVLRNDSRKGNCSPNTWKNKMENANKCKQELVCVCQGQLGKMVG